MNRDKISRVWKRIKNDPRSIYIHFFRTSIGRFLPDKTYNKIMYKVYMEKNLNLDNPKTFNEKIQWLKLYDRKAFYTAMVDKYEARKYVAERVGDDYLIPLLGVWDKFEDIDFGSLPEQFVLKCTHDSGGLVICRDKNSFDINNARNIINCCLRRNYYYIGREWPYKNVRPRIIAEKYMSDRDLYDSGKVITGLTDYKFFCFNGEPKFLYVSKGLEDHQTAYISFYDLDYNLLPFKRSDFNNFIVKPPMPKHFEDMKRISLILSKDCPFLRVDLYEIEEKVYFSELTFSPCSGCLPFDPQEYDFKIGDMLNLDMRSKNINS